MRAMSRPLERASATRWLVRASKPLAPSNGTRSVMLSPGSSLEPLPPLRRPRRWAITR